jgi:predicted MPP superfamily phosphohydrolase
LVSVALSSCASLDRSSLEPRRFDSPAAGAAAPANVIRIAHVSDFHARAYSPVYDQMIARVRAFGPDLILITGDLVTEAKDYPVAERIIRALGDEIPKIAVRGNHDLAADSDRGALDAILLPHNGRLLVNEYREFDFRGSAVTVYGGEDFLSGRFEPPEASRLGEGLALILCHEPGFVARLGREVLDRPGTYAFAGHTHGGQVTFFGLPLVLPRGSGGYSSGEYRVGALRLFVSRGVGTSRIDLRVFARPDVLLHEFAVP